MVPFSQLRSLASVSVEGVHELWEKSYTAQQLATAISAFVIITATLITPLVHIYITRNAGDIYTPCSLVPVRHTAPQQPRIPHRKPSARNRQTLLVMVTVSQWSLGSWQTSSTICATQVMLNKLTDIQMVRHSTTAYTVLCKVRMTSVVHSLHLHQLDASSYQYMLSAAKPDTFCVPRVWNSLPCTTRAYMNFLK